MHNKLRARNNSFRHDVEAELARQKRTSFATVGIQQTSYLMISHLFENFFIFGKTSQEDNSAHLLFAYPSQFSFSGITISQIIESCFPTGINREFLNKRHDVVQDAFCFSMILAGQERLHFCCLHVSSHYGKLPFYIDQNHHELKNNIFCLCLACLAALFYLHTFHFFLV